MISLTYEDMEYSDSEIHFVVSNFSSNIDPLEVAEFIYVKPQEREMPVDSNSYSLQDPSHTSLPVNDRTKKIWEMFHSYNFTGNINDMKIGILTSESFAMNSSEAAQIQSFNDQISKEFSVRNEIGAETETGILTKTQLNQEMKNSTINFNNQNTIRNITQQIYNPSENSRTKSTLAIQYPEKSEPIDSFDGFRNHTQTVHTDFYDNLTSPLDNHSMENKTWKEKAKDILIASYNTVTQEPNLTSEAINEEQTHVTQIQNNQTTIQKIETDVLKENITVETLAEVLHLGTQNPIQGVGTYEDNQEQFLVTSMDENHEIVKKILKQNHTHKISDSVIQENPDSVLGKEFQGNGTNLILIPDTDPSQEPILEVRTQQNQEESMQNPLSEKETKGDFVFASALQSLNTLWGALLFT
jgi:hypothetical protein